MTSGKWCLSSKEILSAMEGAKERSRHMDDVAHKHYIGMLQGARDQAPEGSTHFQIVDTKFEWQGLKVRCNTTVRYTAFPDDFDSAGWMSLT